MLSIDFFIRILSLSFFHPSFVLILLPFLYVQGYESTTSEFLWSSLYAGIVCFFWLLGYLSLKSRNGWKNAKINWDDEIVVVTGGSGGIGGLLAETLAIRNVTVIILDIKPPENEHDNMEYFKCDVSNYEEVQRVGKEIIDEFGNPTILVNNAAIVRGKTILEGSVRDITDTINTNLLSSFWTTKVFLPDMIENNHGHIVTVASSIGFSGLPQLADYCASKAALISFHESLRYELDTRYNAKKVRTTLLCPGEIDTGLFDGVEFPFPFITPRLAPLDVVKPIITALDKNEGQIIFKPYFVYLMPLLRFLPSFIQDLVHKLSGANNGMKTWRGKQGVSKKYQ
ncbi:14029_t:CDS:2 [Funneliformis geosporum]|uniref:Short-chain dehydrogenase/reductase 3 n=1 Tax=Funneliformis geosporum TaxID=1117311 RepID=A0A9W4S9G1_9GLOM|nr:14029_t:CDS:2 [Funneliformis geosporum]